LDVLIALIEYLRSESSKVGYLDNSIEKNMLHKDQEERVSESSADENSENEQVVSGSSNVVLELCINLEPPESLRRLNGKRPLDKTFEIRQENNEHERHSSRIVFDKDPWDYSRGSGIHLSTYMRRRMYLFCLYLYHSLLYCISDSH
jgi:hypothetical protein